MNINRALKSKLFENGMGMMALKGFSYVFPILIIPFLLKKVGVEKYGLIGFGIALTFYFKVISEFGFNLSSIRHVVKYQNDSSKLSEVFSAIINVKIILTCILFIIYASIVFAIDKFAVDWLLYMLCYTSVIGSVFSLTWLFRGLEDIKQIAQISVVVQSVVLSTIFIFVRDESNYYLVPLIYGINDIVIGFVQVYFARKKYNVRYQQSSVALMKYYLKDSVPFFTSNIFLRLFTVSNTIFLGFFVGNVAVGIYTVAEKLYNAYTGFLLPVVEGVLYPYFNRAKNFVFANKAVVALSLLNLVVVALVYLFGEFIIGLIMGIDDPEIFSTFKILLVSCVIIMPMTMLGYSYMSLIDKINYANITTIISSILHVVAVLIMGLAGVLTIHNVAWMICVTNGLCLLMRMYLIHRTTSRSRKEAVCGAHKGELYKKVKNDI